MIGISGTNARPSIAPTFGVENMLGTNPLTFAMPTDEKFPFLLDCATSIVQRGKVEIYAKLNKEMPKGWVIAPDGSSKTDPHQVLADLVAGTAALLPLGGAGEDHAGYKGYGYATVVEILSAALQQGAFLKMLNGTDKNGKKIPYPLGHFFIAIDVAHFTPLPIVQENRRHHPPPAPRLPQGPRRNAHLHRRRKRISHLARTQKEGRARQPRDAKRNPRHARRTRAEEIQVPVREMSGRISIRPVRHSDS